MPLKERRRNFLIIGLASIILLALVLLAAEAAPIYEYFLNGTSGTGNQTGGELPGGTGGEGSEGGLATPEGCSPISACGAISSAGCYYLTTTISSSGTCLTITADDITLDGNGKTLTFNTGGADNSVGILLPASRNNITIKNFASINDGGGSCANSPTTSTFLTSGSWHVPSGVTSVEVLVVAGGGGGGAGWGGGGAGGAGGLVYHSAKAVAPGDITVTVGAGGIDNYASPGNNGDNSVFGDIIALGGGGGAFQPAITGKNGGSGGGGNIGGGGGTKTQGDSGGGTGYGYNGGAGNNGGGAYGGGGGGGAGAVGNDGTTSTGGVGGQGREFAQFASVGGSPAGWFAGGGGGGGNCGYPGGGVPYGGGGAGGNGAAGVAGTANTGGGGGGGGCSQGYLGGTGGSGIVILRYITPRSCSDIMGIRADGSLSNSLIANNSISTAGGLGTYGSNGISIIGASENNNLSSNHITSTNYNGILIESSSSGDTISNNNITSSGSAYDFVNGYSGCGSLCSINDLTFQNQVIKPYKFWGASNITIEDTTYGKIKFLDEIVAGTVGSYLTGAQGTAADLQIGYNYTYVNSAARPTLNLPADLSLYGVSGFTNPVAYRNGVLCSPSICTGFWDLGGGNYSFSVTGWTNYSVGEKPPPPSVTLISPDDNIITTNTSLTFIANVSDDISLANASLWTNISGAWEINETETYGGTVTVNITPDKDTYVESPNPDTNWGAGSWIYLYYSNGAYIRYAFLSYDVSTIPAGSTINSASFKFNNAGNGVPYININRVAANWAELGITWNNQPGVSDLINQVTPVVGWNSVDVTNAVENWYNGSWDNYGMRIAQPNGGPADYVAFKSKEQLVGEHYLEINYTTPAPSSDTVNFTVDNIPTGTYSWNVQAFDSAGQSSWAVANRTFTTRAAAIYNTFNGSTTPFNAQPDIRTVPKPVLERTGLGKIQWLGAVNAEGADFDTNVNISSNFVRVNSSALDASFNTPANITLYGLSFVNPIITWDPEDDGAFVACPVDVCTEISYTGDNLTFNVTGFTSYSSEEGPPSVTLISPDDNIITTNTSITFIANVSSGNNLANASLYTNISGSWQLNDTKYYGNLVTINITPDKDSYTDSWIPDTNYGGSSYVFVVYRTDNGRIKEGYFSYDLSSIPAGVTINSAYFKFYYVYAETHLAYLNRIVTSWTETGVTWNNAPSYSDLIQTFTVVGAGWNSVDVTDAAKNWYNGSWDNYGMKITQASCSGCGGIAFNSKEGSSNIHYLEVTYSIPAPTSDSVNWTLSGIPVGSYGWNVQAFDSAGQSSWADENWTFTRAVCGNNITEIGEDCDGGSCCSASCTFLDSSTLCNASAGVCEQDAYCIGSSATCPAKTFNSSETVCRSSAGVCDLVEYCTESTVDCPEDLKSTSECRASAGSCDIAESCDGENDTCPADTLRPATYICCDAANSCDVAENCTGSSANCSADSYQPNGTLCDDGLSCTVGDTCFSGACTPGTNICGGGGCSEPWVCGAWGPCSSGTQTRSCTCGCAHDNDCDGDHETTRSCECAIASDCTQQACKVVSCTDDQCVYTNSLAGTSCDDNNDCTENDYCSNGACTGNFICECDSDSDCDDGNPCTSESCANTICQYVEVTGPCSDNDDCTENDSCSNGLCTPGKDICGECSEAWNCTAWGSCSNSTQTRSCTCGCANLNCSGDNATIQPCTMQLNISTQAEQELQVGEILYVNVTDESGNPVVARIVLIRPDGSIIVLNGASAAYVVDQSGIWKIEVFKEGYTSAETQTKVGESPTLSKDIGTQISEALQSVVTFIGEPVTLALLLCTVVGAAGVFLYWRKRHEGMHIKKI